MHDAEPFFRAYEPVLHSVLSVSPVLSHLEPGGQSVQELAPAKMLKLPTAHSTHELLDLAPVVFKYKPASHGMHFKEPVLGVYLPTAQSIHLGLLLFSE